MEHNVAKSSDILLHNKMEKTLSKTADSLLRLFDGQQMSYNNLEQSGATSAKKKASSSCIDAPSNKRIKIEQVFQNVVKETKPKENVEMEIKSEESMDWSASLIMPSTGTEEEEDDASLKSAWDEQIGSTITSVVYPKTIRIKKEKLEKDDLSLESALDEKINIVDPKAIKEEKLDVLIQENLMDFSEA